MLIIKLRRELDKKGITIYRLSKLTNIKYELLRRVFADERKLNAEELIAIINSTGIDFEKIK